RRPPRPTVHTGSRSRSAARCRARNEPRRAPALWSPAPSQPPPPPPVAAPPPPPPDPTCEQSSAARAAPSRARSVAWHFLLCLRAILNQLLAQVLSRVQPLTGSPACPPRASPLGRRRWRRGGRRRGRRDGRRRGSLSGRPW